MHRNTFLLLALCAGSIACGREPSRDSNVDVALTLLREGQVASGLKRLGQVETGPQRPPWSTTVVRALLDRRALAAADSLLGLHPEDPADEWRMLRAELREYQGRVDEADAIYAAIPPASSWYPAARTKMAMIAALQQDHEAAIARAREVLAGDGFDKVARAVLAEALLELGRTEEAHEELGLLPEGTKRWMLDARIHLAKGEPAGALDPLRRTLELTPGAPRPLYFLGQAFLGTGQWELAAKPLAKLAAQDPPYEDTQLLWSQALRQLGQVARADSLAAEFRRSSHRREVDLVRAEGIRHGEAGDLEKALELFRDASSREPEHPHLHNDLGTVLARLRRFDEAEAEFRIAARISPRDPTVPRNLANLYQITGDTLRRNEQIARYRAIVAQVDSVSGLR